MKLSSRQQGGGRSGIRPALIKVDFLIPRLQDTTRRQRPHTAYEEWDTPLWSTRSIHPREGPPERGREGWGKEAEDSLHWWTGGRKNQVQVLLRLLRHEARRIFDQRWMIAFGRRKGLHARRCAATAETEMRVRNHD